MSISAAKTYFEARRAPRRAADLLQHDRSLSQARIIADSGVTIELRQSKYLNNLVEQHQFYGLAS